MDVGVGGANEINGFATLTIRLIGQAAALNTAAEELQ
jgi:hypothetical protein